MQAELDSIKIQVNDIEKDSMQLLDIKDTLKNTVNGYSDSTSRVETRVSKYQLKWGDTEAAVTTEMGYCTKLENREINEMILVGAAESTDKCDAGCKVCKKGYYANYKDYDIYQCIER